MVNHLLVLHSFRLKYSYHIFPLSALRLMRHNDVCHKNEKVDRENKKLNGNACNALRFVMKYLFTNQFPYFRGFNFLKKDIYVNKGTLGISDIFD